MTGEQPHKSFPFLDFAGVILCAGALAFVQWQLNTKSDESPELRNLVKLIIIDLACFTVPLLLVKKFLGARLTRTLRLLLAAQVGVVLSTVLIDVPFFYRDLTNGRGDIPGWLLQALLLLLLNNFLVLLLMSCICGLGVLLKAEMD